VVVLTALNAPSTAQATKSVRLARGKRHAARRSVSRAITGEGLRRAV
jgi:hypothetical protein